MACIEKQQIVQRVARMSASSSSSSTTTTNQGSSWVSRLSIAEMKQILKNIPESKTCIERSDLESLVLSRFQSMEDYKQSMEDETTRLSSLRTKIHKVLSQDRGVENFEHYVTSKEHQGRMKQLKKIAPELYDNPSITPRSTWFQHPRYRQNSQMPPFHVHFRHEMQQVLTYLYQAYSAKDASNRKVNIRNASSTFHGSMRGLQGHVSIEEYTCFPTYKNLYPHVDIRFLYTDHRHLHNAEQNVSNSLTRLAEALGNGDSVDSSQIVETLELFLTFDDLLIAHLGEEEEIVVPMSLTDKDLYF